MSYEKKNPKEKDYIWDYSDTESDELFDKDVSPILESDHVDCMVDTGECPKQQIAFIKQRNLGSEKKCEDFEYCIRTDGDVNNEFKRKMFYVVYRTKQRISGAITGAAEGFATGMYIGGKWGGGGGWIMGGFMQALTIILTPFLATPICGILGFMSDRYTVMQLVKDYRYSIAAGGMPPTHGSLE